MSSYAVPPQYLPGSAQRVNQNPMLPLHPLTAAMDAQYAAQDAQLRAKTAKDYADILQQLGYTDEKGQFIPGSASVAAQRTYEDTQFNERQAVKDVNETYQKGNAWFSGRRAEAIGVAEQPYETSLARQGVDLPVKLAGLHEQLGGLIDDYNTQNNINLANAAQRAAQGYTDNPVDMGSSAAGATGGAGAIGANALTTLPSDAGGRSGLTPRGPMPPGQLPTDHPLMQPTGPQLEGPALATVPTPDPTRPGMTINQPRVAGRAAQVAARSY